MRALGLHLSPLVGGPTRPSAIAELAGDSRLVALETLCGDDEVVAAIPPGSLLVVDAPLDVRNETGSRDLERLLAWCDIALMPVAGKRLDNVFGGRRGPELRARLDARAARVLEGAPEIVLRELAWARQHPPDRPALDLAEYRERWLEVRPPAYRPKGRGRARPAGLGPAADLLADVIDLGGWAPTPDPDDLTAIADAARIDAIASAYTAHVALTEPGRAVLVGSPDTGQMLLPADANLRRRLQVNAARMRDAGEIAPDFDIVS